MIISDDLSQYSKIKDIFKTNVDTDLPSETGLDTAVLTDGEESERYHDNQDRDAEIETKVQYDVYVHCI